MEHNVKLFFKKRLLITVLRLKLSSVDFPPDVTTFFCVELNSIYEKKYYY